jgi:hypothetical protein
VLLEQQERLGAGMLFELVISPALRSFADRRHRAKAPSLKMTCHSFCALI